MSFQTLVFEWESHKVTSTNTFSNLYNDDTLTDVTLACEGNKQIEAHKVILSACSQLFRDILHDNSNPHPWIYLQGVTYEDLVLLKECMYLGIAKVDRDRYEQAVTVTNRMLDCVPVLTKNNDCDEDKIETDVENMKNESVCGK